MSLDVEIYRKRINHVNRLTSLKARLLSRRRLNSAHWSEWWRL